MSQISKAIIPKIINFLGWHTNRKIIVIESDDWGSIRMNSLKSYQYFLKAGYPVDKCHYNRYDALEGEDDLTGLFEILSSVKDSDGNHPIITANNIIANPDFEKIRETNFQQYHFETFTETYKKYPKHKNSFAICNQGINAKLFLPQSHGREHLNVHRWIKMLQEKDEDTSLVFEHNMFTLHTVSKPWNRSEFMDAFRYNTLEEKEQMKIIVSEGVTLFREIWGYSPISFMAPSYIWFDELESTLHKLGVKYIQGSVLQILPAIDSKKTYKKRCHFLGQHNNLEQTYLVRNAFFEPSQDQNIDWVNRCLNDISSAFKWNKPAIIQSHRVNFIGLIDPSNRSRNLLLLKQLLSEIIKKWPDVEFMSTPQLGELINTKYKK